MLILAEREPSLHFLQPLLKKHITHDLSKIMNLATVLTPLGIVPENQTTTAGTIEILRQCIPYFNHTGVSSIQNHVNHSCHFLKIRFTVMPKPLHLSDGFPILILYKLI